MKVNSVIHQSLEVRKARILAQAQLMIDHPC